MRPWTVETLEVAINLLVANNLFNLVNRRRMTFSYDASAMLAKETLDFVVTIVESIRQVRCCSAGFTATELCGQLTWHPR